MSEAEVLGDAITGGLVARAVEPDARGPHRGADGGGACLNCGAGLTGAYCAACGQSAHVHRTLGAFGHDLLHGVFHFEGRIWRTLPMLAWRPGTLTRRYVAGERARFVSPLALFLFCAFLMFTVLANLPADGGSETLLDGMGNGLLDARRDIRKDLVRQETRVRVKAIERAELIADKEDTDRVDRQIAEARGEIVVLRAAAAQLNAIRTEEAAAPPSNWFDARWRQAKENPQLLLYKIKSNAYKFGWALIPISLPFLWSLFPFSRRYRMYDHAVFVTYSLGFMSLLLITVSVLEAVNVSESVTGSLVAIIAPVHMYRQLRGAYRLGRINAALRTLLLLIFAGVAALIFIFLLFGLGLAG